ncbi:MAG: inner-rane translocator [Frankiales bacterium]|jgi:ribose transport system permease protein|nr:inner-rane translocator [Frankiales bacterium]
MTTDDSPSESRLLTAHPVGDRPGTAAHGVAARPVASVLRRFASVESARDYGIVFAFAGLFLYLTFASPVFLSGANFRNVLFQSTAIGLIAAAGTLLLISGGFDLSVGSTFALSGVVAAKAVADFGTPTALLLGVLAGLAIGIINGLLTTVGRINPLVTTLASSIVIGGVALVLTNGKLIGVTNPAFATLGTARFLGVQYQTYIWLGFALVCGLVLTFTSFGRYVFAAGGNAEAARLSGIRVNVVRTATYGLSGLAAGIAGVLAASQVSTGQADVGAALPLAAVAAIVVGGTSIWGGEGAVWRTVLGVLLIAMIGNGFTLLQVDPTYQQILQGLIILAAVGLDAGVRRKT